MLKINLKNEHGYSWKYDDGFHFKGYLNHPSDYQAFFAELSTCRNIDEITNQIVKCNGFFAFVEETETSCLAFVDRIRSIPLFFGKTDHDFLISDDAEWVRKNLHEWAMDEETSTEIMLTGYVTGNDTLFSEVKQLRAGEYLVFDKSTRTTEIKTYYYYESPTMQTLNVSELIKRLDTLHLTVFKEVVDQLNGRQAVIPLSGGQDSRLIVFLLKRLGYENVFCYTYGKPEHTEVSISQAVADVLGYDWIFIPYKKEMFKQLPHEEHYQEYLMYSGQYSSLPHIQDYPAVRFLIQQKLISEDAVFIPGLSYDLLAGSHVSKYFLQYRRFNKKDILHHIMEHHYRLWDFRKLKIPSSWIYKRINAALPLQDYFSSLDIANASNIWMWQERVTKFIVNSIRVYEYLGHQWMLPLWDVRFIEFWNSIPLELRYKRKLFYDYVMEEEKNLANVPMEHHPPLRGISGFARNRLPKFLYNLVYRIKRCVDQKKYSRQVVASDGFNWFQMFTETEIDHFVCDGGYNVNSLFSEKYIDFVKEKLNQS